MAVSPVRLAAIDIGTNSIRLIVAEVESDGRYRVLDEEREMTRLGHGLFARGRLASEPMERSLDALAKMKVIADGFLVAELRAVATSAVREASNGRAFCQEVRRRCGLRVEVIPGEEEAQLALRSARRHFDLTGRSAAIVDIGGGSMEVTLTAGTVVDEVLTLPLGAVRLTEHYDTAGTLSPKRWRKLRRGIDRVLDEKLRKPPFHPEIMIGSGGTFTNLAEMAQLERDPTARPVQGYAMSRADVVHLMHRLRATPLAERREIPGLNPRRADIIVAGAAAVARVAKRLGTERILVNDGGLRDGLLLAMIAERFPKEAGETARPISRLDSARAFARQCRSNERHCEQVARLATQLFDGLAERFNLPSDARELLEAAALLHDIGYVINHAKHHKHAYHLILNGDLQGFSQRELEIVACVARYHRKAFPSKRHSAFARLDRPDRRLVRALAGVLRVADGLDRTHTQRITAVTCATHRGFVELTLQARTDPRVEIWDAERKSKLFERAFHVEPRFVWVREAARVDRRHRLRLAAAS
ncbi:MAG TPA: Ppx/GppA phosphatase family protein [Gemmatimonadales bacterium]|nr:Ppx/GppA phosphatase family protein [Gemmatimonadales bacterium]